MKIKMIKMAASPISLTKFTLLLCIIISTTTLLVQPSNATDPLYHICSSFSSKPTTSYKSNLNTLLTTLTSKTPPTGFSLASYPPTQPTTSTAYGLALCRGDTSPSDCRTCIHNASTELPNLCPTTKAAVIWYDYCLIKYSDENFFGVIDTQNKFTLVNVFTIGNNPELFKTKVKALLAKLSAEATEKKMLYAAGEDKLDTFTNLYGLVQCTRDLSSRECRKCLDEVVGEFPDCCDAKQGGRVVAASCNFRYEIYPFVNSS